MCRMARQILTSVWNLESLRKVLRLGSTNQCEQTKAARGVLIRDRACPNLQARQKPIICGGGREFLRVFGLEAVTPAP